jgi:hypothetical protein
VPELKVMRLGRALLPADADSEELIKRIPERQTLKAKVPVPRVHKWHDLFFGVIADACHHWPEGADPLPEGDPELLRSWLLCKANHCTWTDYPLSGNDKFNQITVASIDAEIQLAKRRGEYPFMRERWIKVDGEKVPVMRVYRAKSIAHDAIDEVEFNDIKQRVFEVIEAVLGVEIKTMIEAYHERKAKEHRQRAA